MAPEMPQFMMVRKNAVEVPAECPDDACVCILAIVAVPVCTPPSITNFLPRIYRCHQPGSRISCHYPHCTTAT